MESLLLFYGRFAVFMFLALTMMGPSKSLAGVPGDLEWQNILDVHSSNPPYGQSRPYAMSSDSAGNIYTFYGPESTFQLTETITSITKHLPSGTEVKGANGESPWFTQTAPVIYNHTRIDRSTLVIDDLHDAVYLLVSYVTPNPDDYVVDLYKHDINTGQRLWSHTISYMRYENARLTVDGNGYPWIAWGQEFVRDGVSVNGIGIRKLDPLNGLSMNTSSVLETNSNIHLQSIGSTGDRFIVTYQSIGTGSNNIDHDLVANIYDITGPDPGFLTGRRYSWGIQEPIDDETQLFFHTPESTQLRHSPVFSDGAVTGQGYFSVGGYYGFYRSSYECELTGSEGGIDSCSMPRFYPVIITLNIEDASVVSTYIENGTSRSAWITAPGSAFRQGGFTGSVVTGPSVTLKQGRGDNALIMLSAGPNNAIWEVEASGNRLGVRRQQAKGYFYNGAELDVLSLPAGGSACRVATYLNHPVFTHDFPSVSKEFIVLAGNRIAEYPPVNGLYNALLWPDCQTDAPGFWDSYYGNKYKASLSLYSSSYCVSRGISTYYEWVDSIMVGPDLRETGNNNGYLNYTQTSQVEFQMGNNALTLTPGFPNSSYLEHWNIWIDLNHDFDFSDNELLYSNSSNTIISTNVNIPVTARSGETMMRVSMQYRNTVPACSEFMWGEVEDYRVYIVP